MGEEAVPYGNDAVRSESRLPVLLHGQMHDVLKKLDAARRAPAPAYHVMCAQS